MFKGRETTAPDVSTTSISWGSAARACRKARGTLARIDSISKALEVGAWLVHAVAEGVLPGAATESEMVRVMVDSVSFGAPADSGKVIRDLASGYGLRVPFDSGVLQAFGATSTGPQRVYRESFCPSGWTQIGE